MSNDQGSKDAVAVEQGWFVPPVVVPLVLLLLVVASALLGSR